jgi:hypothetical protein
MFFDEFIGEGFYQPQPTRDRALFTFGQIFVTHAYYPHENLQLWRPVIDPGEPTQSIAEVFRLEAARADAFRRRFPLRVPELQSNEEFIALRAKKRPVILLRPELAPLTDTRLRGVVQKRRCLVAQVRGLYNTATREAKFSSEFVERMRKMEFPNLMFLPRKAGVFEVDSMVRLDEIQTVFAPHLEPAGFALCTEVADMLLQQFKYFLTGEADDNDFLLLRNLLLNPEQTNSSTD